MIRLLIVDDHEMVRAGLRTLLARIPDLEIVGEASGAEESFSEGLLEYPQFTRPQVFEGRTIPEILTSGDHAKVAAWRRAEAERLTAARRPDLWAAYLARKSPQNRPKSKG